MTQASKLRKGILIGLFLFMTIYRSLYIFGIHGVDCPSDWLTPVGPCNWTTVAFELLLWGGVCILFLLELLWGHEFRLLFEGSKKVWPVFLFVFYAVLSLTWSILFSVTLYKAFVLFASTILAVYMGRLLGEEHFLNACAWFFAIVCVANLGFVLLLPQYGIMSDPFYHGAWNGIFWHRNYLGCFMALASAVFLINILAWKLLSRSGKWLNPVMLLLAVFLLVKSKSATGILTAAVLVGLCLLLAAWLRWGRNLKPKHYYIIGGVAVTVIALICLKLDFIFGLLGRNTSLTGRIPMWSYLLQNVIGRRPLLGYGYGAIWNLQGFRTQLAATLGWSSQVVIGDNGLMDIGLHLGIIGVVLMVALIVAGLVRAIRHFLQERTTLSALPMLLLIFVVVANISLSLILESETFTWAAVVASQVAIADLSRRPKASPEL